MIQTKLKSASIALLALTPSLAFAAGTSAGVEIKLQSTATYVDGIGQSQSVSSNEVIVIVNESYDFDITDNPDPLKVAPGNTADYSYLITNTGNAYDTFKVDYTASGADVESMKVFYDANLNGQVDAGDKEISDGNSTPSIAPDAVAGLIVQITTKTSATTPYAISESFTITSDGDTNETETKSTITVAYSDSEGILDVNFTANTNAASSGTTIDFTVFGSNTGMGSVYSDGVPLGDSTTIVPGAVVEIDLSAVLSSFNIDNAGGSTTYEGVTINSVAPATATAVYWDAAAGAWQTANTTGISSSTAKIGFLVQGANYTEELFTVGQEFEYDFSISTASSVSDSVLTLSASATFSEDSSTTSVTADSNTIAISLSSNTFGSTALADIDVYSGTLTSHPAVVANPTGTTPTKGTDTTATGNRSAGEEIFIPLTVTNPTGGFSTDAYNITLSNGYSADGVIVELLQADGVTPLQDTNGDTIRDTGNIASAASTTIVARIIIDETADGVTGSAITITASSTEGSATDTTTITIDDIFPAGVDIAVDGAAGDGNATGDNPTTFYDATNFAVSAGGSASVILDISNTRTTSTDQLETGDFDSYALTYTAPAGVVVKFYENVSDATATKELSNDELQEILNTSPLNPDTSEATNQFEVFAVVYASDSATAGANTVKVTATSLNNSSISDSITFDAIVTATTSIDLEPEIFATVVPGGNVLLTHSIVNTGNAATGDVTVSLGTTLDTSYSAQWESATGATIVDGTGNHDPGTITVTNIAANSSTSVTLRLSIPSSVPAGETLSLQISAAGTGIADSVIDIVQVIAGNLDLVKEQGTASGSYASTPITSLAPGEKIYYRTSFENKGSTALKTVVLYEPIPEHTSLSSATVTLSGDATASTLEFSTDGGVTWSTTAPTTLANTTNIRVSLTNDLNPGASGTIEFEVAID